MPSIHPVFRIRDACIDFLSLSFLIWSRVPHVTAPRACNREVFYILLNFYSTVITRQRIKKSQFVLNKFRSNFADFTAFEIVLRMHKCAINFFIFHRLQSTGFTSKLLSLSNVDIEQLKFCAGNVEGIFSVIGCFEIVI